MNNKVLLILLLFLFKQVNYNCLNAQWKFDNGPFGGNANEIVVNGSVILTNITGIVYKSIDNGTSWEEANNGLNGNYILSLAIKN